MKFIYPMMIIVLLSSCIKKYTVTLPADTDAIKLTLYENIEPDIDIGTTYFLTEQDINEIINNYSTENNIGIIIENRKFIIPEYISEEKIILYHSLLETIGEVYSFNAYYKNSSGIRKNIKYIDKQITIYEKKFDINNISLESTDTDLGIWYYLFQKKNELLEQYIQIKTPCPIFIPKLYYNTNFIIEYLVENDFVITETNYDVILSSKNENRKLFEFLEYLFVFAKVNINNYYNGEEFENIGRLHLIMSISNILIRNLEINEYTIPNIYYEINNDINIINEDWNNREKDDCH